MAAMSAGSNSGHSLGTSNRAIFPMTTAIWSATSFPGSPRQPRSTVLMAALSSLQMALGAVFRLGMKLECVSQIHFLAKSSFQTDQVQQFQVSSIPVSVDAVFDVKHGLPSHGNRGRDIRYDGGKCVVKPFLGLEGLQFLLCCLDVGRVLRAGGPEDEDELFAGTHPVYVTVWLQVESEVRDSETFIRNVSS